MSAKVFIIGILDDGWAGLSDAARQALSSAGLIIGVGRTLELVKAQLPAAETRDMDGALTQSPAWIHAARAEGKTVAVLATGDPLCHGIASYLLASSGITVSKFCRRHRPCRSPLPAGRSPGRTSPSPPVTARMPASGWPARHRRTASTR